MAKTFKTKEHVGYLPTKGFLTNKEIYGIAITSIVLGFAFSFNDWGPENSFQLAIGFKNLAITAVLVGTTLLIREAARRKYAETEEAIVEYRGWPAGWFYAVLLAFLTKGIFILAISGSVNIKSRVFTRAGRKTILSHLGPDEIALIILVGILTNVVLAAFAQTLITLGFASYITTQLFRINAWMAFFSILPIFKFIPLAQSYIHGLLIHPGSARAGARAELEQQIAHVSTKLVPNFEGEQVFFGSRVYWLFSFAFVTFAILTLIILNPLASILLSALLATAILIYIQYKF